MGDGRAEVTVFHKLSFLFAIRGGQNRERQQFGIAHESGAYYHTGMRTISLKLPDDLLAHLDSEANTRGVTKSQLVRESLEAALRKPAKGRGVSCFDLARDLAGAIKGPPRDLAENPKYLEGFGE